MPSPKIATCGFVMEFNHLRGNTSISEAFAVLTRSGLQEWSSESLRSNLHHVALLQSNAIAETEAIGAEEVHVHIARPAMRLVFEMMMFDVLQGCDTFQPRRSGTFSTRASVQRARFGSSRAPTGNRDPAPVRGQARRCGVLSPRG